MNKTPFGPQADHIYMRYALMQAARAYAKNEVPIGAIIVEPSGIVVARAHNQVESKKTQRAHAESLVIERANKKRKAWRLDGCWLYVTLEPCTMCIGLIRLSRLAGVVYAAESPLFGYRHDLDIEGGSRVYKRDFQIQSGVCADEAAALMKRFFKKKREQSSE
jgi:tRNA(adenine34) deaminase